MKVGTRPSTGFAYSGAGQADRVTAGPASFASGIGDQVMEQVNGSTATYLTRLPDGTLFSMRTGGASYYYLADNVGSVVGLVDATGNRVATYAYDPYGSPISTSGTLAGSNPFRFGGGFFEASNGLIKFGARYYDPAIGRWTQLDPSGQDSGYLYAENDPVTISDGTGELPTWLSDPINFLKDLDHASRAVTRDVERVFTNAVKYTYRWLKYDEQDYGKVLRALERIYKENRPLEGPPGAPDDPPPPPDVPFG